jgi:hypothetical protein
MMSETDESTYMGYIADLVQAILKIEQAAAHSSGVLPGSVVQAISEGLSKTTEVQRWLEDATGPF